MASSILENLLRETEDKYGKDSFSARMLRDQIAKESRGQSAQELYLTGSVARVKGDKAEEAPPKK